MEWDAVLNATGYTVYYGPSPTQTTNRVPVGISLSFNPTNAPSGTNWFRYSVTGANGVESDPTPAVPLLIAHDWKIEDWTALNAAQATALATTTNYHFTLSSLTGRRFLRVRANRVGSPYVGVAMK